MHIGKALYLVCLCLQPTTKNKKCQLRGGKHSWLGVIILQYKSTLCKMTFTSAVALLQSLFKDL